MAAVYYVDTENVGDAWIDFLELPESRFVVFYTGHSPRIAYPHAIALMNGKNRPEFVECYEGNNGLDFQLVSYLGYELHRDPTQEMFIISNDTGFEVVARFWRDRGMQVQRVSPTEMTRMWPTENLEEPIFAVDPITVFVPDETPEMVHGVALEELYTIVNCCTEKPYIYSVCVHLYGNDVGEELFTYLKETNYDIPDWGWNGTLKFKKLWELIVKYSELQTRLLPPAFDDYMLDHISGEKKTMQAMLNKVVGGYGPELHKQLKPYYKILATIKNS